MGKRKGYFSSTLVLVAALDEEKDLGLTISGLSQYLWDYKVLVLDGKSRGSTGDVAKSFKANVIYQ
ncbi:MAG: hypothetical protein NWF10_04805 [Candidatus Bathyarchaeota archaeon]|nr:hypothetical protein [Candidatus Bathyarchaeota archaeon]